MTQYKVQVIDEAGNLIANKTVEATDYVDACAEVVRQANKAAETDDLLILDGGPALDTGRKLG